jgi:hypothetical protein
VTGPRGPRIGTGPCHSDSVAARFASPASSLGRARYESDKAGYRRSQKYWEGCLCHPRRKHQFEAWGGITQAALKWGERAVPTTDQDANALRGEHNACRTEPKVATPRQCARPKISNAAEAESGNHDVTNSEGLGGFTQLRPRPGSHFRIWGWVADAFRVVTASHSTQGRWA